MYALNLGIDGRCLSAAPLSMAPVGATFVQNLPEGDLYEYRYENGAYFHDPLPEPETVDMVTISADELAVLQEKAAAHDILMEGAASE